MYAVDAVNCQLLKCLSSLHEVLNRAVLNLQNLLHSNNSPINILMISYYERSTQVDNNRNVTLERMSFFILAVAFPHISALVPLLVAFGLLS